MTMFQDNPELWTLLGNAITVGTRAVQSVRGELEYDPHGYDDLDTDHETETTESKYDQDAFDLKFSDRHSKSRLRHYMRKPQPAKKAFSMDEHNERLVQDCKDDFMAALERVERNLNRHHRTRLRDLKAAIARCFNPQFNTADEMRADDVKLEHLVNFLRELQDEQQLATRLSMFESDSLPACGYNLSEHR
jgi:hypothetical protein